MLITLNFFPSASVAATPKAGAKCSQSGSISLYKSKKFICTRTGKILVWKEIVSPKVSTTPYSESKNDSGVPTPNKLNEVHPKTPSSFDDLIQNFQGIRYAAWSKSRNKIMLAKKVTMRVDIKIGPNSKLSYNTPQIAFENVAKLYEGFTIPKQINMIAFNYLDREWAINVMDSLFKHPYESSIRPFFDVNCKSEQNCGLANIWTDSKMEVYFPISMPSIGDGSGSGTLESHEFTHAIQEAVMNQVRPEPLTNPWPPSWYQEGQAEFTEHAAMYSDSFTKFDFARKEISGSLYKSRKYDSHFIEKFFSLEPTQRHFTTNEDRWNQYDLGAMFIEVLVALKGPESTMQIYSLASQGVAFNEAFKLVFDKSFDTALPIISKVIALQIGNA